MQRILILFLIIFPCILSAQLKATFYVDGDKEKEVDLKDTLALKDYAQERLFDWVNNGFYFSGLDSISTDSTLHVFLHKGERYDLKIESGRFRNPLLNINRQLRFYENHGYPFASIRLDSLTVEEKELRAKFGVVKGPEIVYDSAYLFSETKTNRSYLYQLLDIVPGDPFKQKNYRVVANKIQRSSFLSLNRPTDLSFKDGLAKVYLDISESESGSFQGVIGLQQNQAGGSTAVGSLELDLQNLFRSGKQFRFFWERFADESQRLDLFYKHTFLLGSKLSPAFGFELLRQDTTFITRSSNIELGTYISPKTEFSVTYQNTTGTLLTTDIEVINEEGLADFSRNIYGIQVTNGDRSRLNSLSNELGWRAVFSAGRKSIDRNLSLPDAFYDSIQLSTNFYRFEGELFYQKKILKRQAFFHHISGGYLENDELVANELYRIGGLATLRGFNEKEFFVEAYALSRMEFRSFFENRSYAFLFFDQLIYDGMRENDSPFGLGLGFALATSSGQFSFALAVGNSENQDIAFSGMKAHFGYVSRF